MLFYIYLGGVCMGLRVNKRIKIAKGIYLNVGKKGMSASVKVGNVTYNSRGRVTASIPKTGISYSTSLKDKVFEKKRKDKKSLEQRVQEKQLKLEETKSQNEFKKEELKTAINNFKNSVPIETDINALISSTKRNLIASRLGLYLSVLICVLAVVLMLVNIFLGGGFLLLGLLLARASKLNMKKYKVALEKSEEKQLSSL